MLRRLCSLATRMAVLAVVGLLALAYLVSGLDEADAISARRILAVNDAPKPAAKDTPQPAAEGDQANLPARDPNDLEQTLAELNRCFEAEWAEASVEPAPQADWLTICRRISLALVGTGLSLQEVRELQSLPESDRVSVHLDRLLGDPRYHDYWAERFTRLYVGAEDGPFIAFRRRRFRSWLSDALAANQRYDRIIRQLVTAEGLATDRPEVNFLTVTLNANEANQPDPIRLAARTSRAMLGLRIDCMQCHDDFLGNVSLGDGDELREGTQRDFHSLAAFYAGARMNGLQGIRSEERTYEYHFLRDTQTSKVEPTVPFAKHLLPEQGSPRSRLATWLTHPKNKQAARAIASRIWALLYGRAITPAVDNIPLDKPTHPAIDLLAADFVEHGFDLRRLVRLVVMSGPFQRDSEASFEITQRHEDAWSVFPLVRLRPEQVAGTVIQASRVKTVDRESSLLIQLMKLGGVNDFVTRYGDIGEDEFNQDNVTITQRLIMLNGELIRESVDDNPVLNSCSHVLMFSGSDEHAVESTYLCVLNRLPDEEESRVFTEKLAKSKNRNETIADLYWVLLNSSELAWNH